MKKILMVDDSQSIRMVVIGMLRKLGEFEFIEANDGSDALALVKEHPDMALILTDYNMPRMDGVEFAREARKINAEVPIVMISIETDKRIITRAAQAGINEYLHKPFQPEKLLSKIGRFLPVNEESE